MYPTYGYRTFYYWKNNVPLFQKLRTCRYSFLLNNMLLYENCYIKINYVILYFHKCTIKRNVCSGSIYIRYFSLRILGMHIKQIKWIFEINKWEEMPQVYYCFESIYNYKINKRNVICLLNVYIFAHLYHFVTLQSMTFVLFSCFSCSNFI